MPFTSGHIVFLDIWSTPRGARTLGRGVALGILCTMFTGAIPQGKQQLVAQTLQAGTHISTRKSSSTSGPWPGQRQTQTVGKPLVTASNVARMES